MARYVERAENLARLIDTNDVAARELYGEAPWDVLLRINGDVHRFAKLGREPSRANVLQYYAIDPGNPTSVVSSLRQARENARVLRHVISTEMWTSLNVTYQSVIQHDSAELIRMGSAAFCATVKEGCQAFQGVADGTFVRDESFAFFQIGKYLERGDQTTRLLDAKSPYLSDYVEADDPVTVSRLNAMLRAASAYHIYRRKHPLGITPSAVIDFMLRDPELPRSVARALKEIDRYAAYIEGKTETPLDEAAKAAFRDLEQAMETPPAEPGAPAFFDWIQSRFADIATGVGRTFFARGS